MEAAGGARPGWQLDELGSAGRENLDPAHVAGYDRKEDAEAERELALLERLGMTRGSTLVELGPGTGQLTVVVAPRCGRLVAVDVSEPMLERLRQKLAERGIDNVEVVRAGFLTYSHQGEPADFVYSRYALHHLPDFWKAVALARARSILRPGGLLRLWDIVFDFEPAEAEERVEAWCASADEAPPGEWSRAELEEHIRDEHSTFTWLLESMIERSGFRLEQAEYSDDGFFAKYVARAV